MGLGLVCEGLCKATQQAAFLQVLEDSRTELTAADVLPDGPFPQDEKLKDGMVFPISLSFSQPP